MSNPAPPPDLAEPVVRFIGRARTPWASRADCPRNMARAREHGLPAAVHIDAAWREYLKTTREEGVHLISRFFNGSGRYDDLRTNPLPVHFPTAERVDGGLIDSDKRPQRASDEMQFILNDQIGRTKR